MKVEHSVLQSTIETTAYTAGFESTGKRPGDPGYGLTFSGAVAQEGRTVAAGPAIPLGTRVFIPCLADWPNGGLFIVEDRGGAISNAHLDIFMANLAPARAWGRQRVEVLFWLPAETAKAIAAQVAADRRLWRS